MMRNSDFFDLIVVGGGPAGLMAASTAAERSLRVLLLEKKDKVGLKLLLSGGGRGNFTHDASRVALSSAFPELRQQRFLKPAFSALDSFGLRTWFSDNAVPSQVEASGKVFPSSGRAGDLLEALYSTCKRNGVHIRCESQVKSIQQPDSREGRFSLSTADRYSYVCNAVILATGGSTFKFTGSEGDGYRMARLLGHRITPLTSALQSIALKDKDLAALSGLSLEDVQLSLMGKRSEAAGKKKISSRGELLFTHFGLSGPAALNISRWLTEEALATLQIDFLPALSSDALEKDFISYTRQFPNRLAKSYLLEKLPQRLGEVLVHRIWPDAKERSAKQLAHVTREERLGLIENLKAFSAPMGPPRPYDQGMLTRGGVDLPEIEPKTMQSRLCPGLYIVGELLDIDGPGGGYNLQSAFSTGYLAGLSVSQK